MGKYINGSGWKSLGVIVLLLLLFSACSKGRQVTEEERVEYTQKQQDSLTFAASHHYSNNYNFVVKADSLVLFSQQPEEIVNGMLVDTLVVKKNDHLVVADIRIIPLDSIDSVWVQLARDQYTFGWTRESQLLPAVVPDQPISQFISAFSDKHLLIFLYVISIIAFIYFVRMVSRMQVPFVHLRDIPSVYPTLLALLVASAAAFYASIQNFAPDTWRHFYYHPTLNPFVVPPLLAVFLISVWAIVIVGLACVDDVRHKLSFSDAILYLCGLAAVCAVNYIVFSVSTLYYIGYFLLLAYFVFAIRRYLSNHPTHYVCGHCGEELPHKGKCPYCGVINK